MAPNKYKSKYTHHDGSANAQKGTKQDSPFIGKISIQAAEDIVQDIVLTILGDLHRQKERGVQDIPTYLLRKIIIDARCKIWKRKLIKGAERNGMLTEYREDINYYE